MSADLAVQKAIIARFIATPAVVDLVPASAILDRHTLPAPSPSIIVGESQALEGDDLARKTERVVCTLHVWKKEVSLVGVKAIAGAMRASLHAGRLGLGDDYRCGDVRVSEQRFIRDPDGETSHGIVTVEALVGEA